MSYLKKLSIFITPYKSYAVLNIIANICYALFSTLAMLSLMPMINVLFGEGKKVSVKPAYSDLSNLKDYAENYLNYIITSTSENHGPERSLLYMIVLIVSLFLLKNIFSATPRRGGTLANHNLSKD